jgi:hypothetical protein
MLIGLASAREAENDADEVSGTTAAAKFLDLAANAPQRIYAI